MVLNRISLNLCLVLGLSGCAGIKKSDIVPLSSKVPADAVKQLENAQRPSEIINSYKIEDQKSVMNEVITEKYTDRPTFLKRNLSKKVRFWMKYFGVTNKDRFERFIRNGEKYRPFIESTFEDYGLPKELYYVGLIESGYYLGAKSHASAVGPWQFIKDTARRYGLVIKAGIDERKNIIKATHAAALFFQDLYNIFGSWELALSAYNAGEYGIIRRIRGANTRNYYELSKRKVIPKETRHYVPKVLAAMELLSNPKKYSLNIEKPKVDLYSNTTEITLRYPVRMSTLAKKANISLTHLKSLNNGIYWKSTPRVRGGLKIHLPANIDYSAFKNLKPYKRKVASSHSRDKKRQASKTKHIVRRGEGLLKIAKRYDMSLDEIKRVNKLRSTKIYIGQTLKVGESALKSYRSKTRSYAYKVKRGDNLYSIARLNHTSISKIMRDNRLSNKTLFIGQRIKLPMKNKSYYTVREGDYLIKIAQMHNMGLSDLKKINGLYKGRIYPGQKLIVEN